jgi:SAM-dependent methyltransferase
VIDWGQGEYEQTAAELEPVSERVVALAGPQAGERLLDVATGTGNAALIAARTGATVTGIDAAERLIEVARGRAADQGIEVDFRVGDLQELPFPDASFDVVLSVFGIVFAPDADAAFSEAVRVLRAGGRAVLTAWIPAGGIDAMVGAFARAAAAAAAAVAPPGGSRPQRFAWHDPEAVSALAARHGVEATFHDGALTITGASPEAYLQANERHPMSLAMRPLLERAGTAEATRAAALDALRKHNEDPSGLRLTSPYRLIEIRRP